MLPGPVQFPRGPDEVEAGGGGRDAYGEEGRVPHRHLRRLVLCEVEAAEELRGAWSVDAERCPGVFGIREIFDLHAGEGGIAAQDLTCGICALRLGIDEDTPIGRGLEGAQVRQDATLRVQERGVSAEMRVLWDLVRDDGVQHCDRVLAR